MATLNERFADLLEDFKLEHFSAEYADKVNKAEVLGVLIASYFQWDGRQCFETLSYALEDSNFHRVNRALSAAWDSVEGKAQ
jgi:hypothetical protein